MKCSLPSSLGLLGLVLAPLGCGDDGVAASADETGIQTLDGGVTGDDTTGGSGDDTTTGPAGPCENGEQDGDETDVDCGGSCEPCAPGGACNSPADCDTMICSGGFCQTPTCYDGMQNGDEEGVDCGSTCPNTCPGTECDNDAQCGDGQFCFEGDCLPSACDNDIQDTLESDVDCGGPDCPDCPAGANCDGDADCVSQICDETCQAPACDDGVRNGTESDIDCGGPCDPCSNGSDCLVGTDCQEGVCIAGTCIDDTCTDLVENGNETDIDCGGSECEECDIGDSCLEADDCVHQVCLGNICFPNECDDMVHNGDETDVDCGGSCGATCMPGLDCDSSEDCIEGVCEFGQCSAPDCNDGVTNGDETDIDCGGGCGPTCVLDEDCLLGTDCEQGVCQANVCAPPACGDGVVNGDESDIDCGGSCGPSCTPGENCVDAGDCVEGVCILGVCEAPTCSDGVENGLEGGIDCAGLCSQPCPLGGEETVNTTLFDFQVRPMVAAAPDGSFFVVVWASFPVMGASQDGDGAAVFARVYDPMGMPLTGELQVNSTTAGDQSFPAVDANNNGFVVIWQGPDGDSTGIFAQRMDSAGGTIGPELELAEDIDGQQRRPDVGLQLGGDFVACWETRPEIFADIVCRRFDGVGAPVGGEFVVNSEDVNEQNLPVVDVAITGNFVVAWQSSASQDGDGVGVFMRRYNAAGIPLTINDEQVNEFTMLDQQGPAIGMNLSGEFVITWTSDDQDGSSTGVYARRYNPIGAPLGGEFQVHTTTAGAQNNPAVDLAPDGDFAIVWQTADDGVLTGIFGQRYDQDGATVNTEFLVNPTILGLQEEPDVAILGMDDIIGVWSDGDAAFTDRDIRMQRYEALFP